MTKIKENLSLGKSKEFLYKKKSVLHIFIGDEILYHLIFYTWIFPSDLYLNIILSRKSVFCVLKLITKLSSTVSELCFHFHLCSLITYLAWDKVEEDIIDDENKFEIFEHDWWLEELKWFLSLWESPTNWWAGMSLQLCNTAAFW